MAGRCSRTSSATNADGDRFTLLVDTVTPLMTTVRSDALGVIELTRVGDEELVQEPRALLKLLYDAFYPHRRHLAAKVRAFIDMLVDRFAEQQCWFRPATS